MTTCKATIDDISKVFTFIKGCVINGIRIKVVSCSQFYCDGKLVAAGETNLDTVNARIINVDNINVSGGITTDNVFTLTTLNTSKTLIGSIPIISNIDQLDIKWLMGSGGYIGQSISCLDGVIYVLKEEKTIKIGLVPIVYVESDGSNINLYVE